MTQKITKEIIENENLYACSICGLVYSNESHAIDCEESHKTHVRIPGAS